MSPSPASASTERFCRESTPVKQGNPRNSHKQHQSSTNHINALSALSATAGAAITSPGRSPVKQAQFLSSLSSFFVPVVCARDYSAASSASPVRIRMTVAIQRRRFCRRQFFRCKPPYDDIDHFIELVISNCHINFYFGRKLTLYSAPRYSSACPF